MELLSIGFICVGLVFKNYLAFICFSFCYFYFFSAESS